jgi:acetyl-CoA carboxylase carboxyl transferase subunit alpha
MEKKKLLLEFEKPIYELHEKIEQLETLSKEQDVDMTKEIKNMRERASELEEKIYENLSPLQILQIARHQYRPTTLDYIKLLFHDFVELKGDRCFADDPAIVGGFCSLDGQSVMVLGHQKGQDTKENIRRNFGMPQPEGYRKALRLMKLAEKFNIPIITFVDTPGAFPGLGGEERGQAEAIAHNLREMSALKVPVISIITGEGGSGGAIGIAVANKVLMLQYSVYSVISPEGCASILWRDATKADLAAKAQKITAPDLLELKVIDGIIPEPAGGAHRDYATIAQNMKKALQGFLTEYKKMPPTDIVDGRYKKFRNLGLFNE